jgi:molecular chaperone DnaK (HSP70)
MVHFGIDFGTANTRVSVFEGSALPRSLAIGRSGVSPFMMPSACWVDQNGDVIVGEHALAQPSRLKFIKRYWQDRSEDRGTNPWLEGRKEFNGRFLTCEQMVQHVVAEALARAFEEVGQAALHGGFTANIVCPVEFDRNRRLKLVEILAGRGAKSVSLSNVIDEPLAAAVLYGRLETVPPTKLDILIFDAGAGTVDAAVVRFKEHDNAKHMTVLAEQGRCSAGSDLDRAMEDLVSEKLMNQTEVKDRASIYKAYSGGEQASGQVMFEEDCEQIKQALATNDRYSWRKPAFLGHAEIEFVITRSEFESKSRRVLNQMEALVTSVLKEAASFCEDFRGVDLSVLIGGTAKFPAVTDLVMKHCSGAKVVPSTVLDEMLSTARGVGFTKDFRDLVLKRPPYRTDVRVTLTDGSSHLLCVHEAFEPFDWRLSYSTSCPFHQIARRFQRPIDAIDVSFTSPAGEVVIPTAAELPRSILLGQHDLTARLDIMGRLFVGGRSIRAPYFSQIGLKPAKPYERRSLNAPEVYPDDN